jgi:hypothetical protein
MADVKLASSVVRSLSEYLTYKSVAGPKAFSGSLEELLGEVESRLSDPYGEEIISRFKEAPGGDVESDTLRLHLGQAITRDPEFARRLAAVLAGKKSTRRGARLAGAVGLAVVVLGTSFVLGRVTAGGAESGAAPVTVTSTVDHTVTETATPSEEASSTAPAPSPPTSGSAVPGVSGDGSSLAEGTPVFLTELPTPNNVRHFGFGDHDVQFTPYNNSLWEELASCNSSGRSAEQQFRLKNFSRLEVKAVGTDSKADPDLAVRFDVFVNNDNVNPVASVTVNPGEAKPLAADLPADVFTLTLRMSLTKTDMPECAVGNAVWGSPYVVAAGS